MIISSQQVQSIIKAYGVSGSRKSMAGEYPKPVSRNDSLELSSKARELNAVRQVIAGTPEVRAGKIAQIKQAVTNGTYRVDSRDIAHRMLVRSLVDRIIEGEQDEG